MSHSFSSPRVVCRPALPSDAVDVLEFTKFIWDGHDYIQYVWADWLADPQGRLIVAEYGGHAVGLGKITWISPGQWWLEGLRVDPKYQGLKIGSHIHEYLDDWWKQNAGGALRLMTSSQRVQVHHLCDRLGYDKLGEVRSYQAPSADSNDGVDAAWVAVEPGDAARAAAFAAEHLKDYNGLMDSGWQFSEPDEPALLMLIRQRMLWWWRGGDGLLAAWEDEADDQRILGVGFAAVERARLNDMLHDVRGLAHKRGRDRVLWMAPVMPWIEDMLRAGEFSTDWDGTAYLYGKTE